MTLLWTWITNFITGGLLDKVVGWFQTGLATLSNTEIAKVQAQATVSTTLITAARDVEIADKGWWLTASMKPVAFYVFMLHVGAVVFDTTFKLHWGIPKLPEPYQTMEANVLYMCIGLAGAVGLFRIIKK